MASDSSEYAAMTTTMPMVNTAARPTTTPTVRMVRCLWISRSDAVTSMSIDPSLGSCIRPPFLCCAPRVRCFGCVGKSLRRQHGKPPKRFGFCMRDAARQGLRRLVAGVASKKQVGDKFRTGLDGVLVEVGHACTSEHVFVDEEVSRQRACRLRQDVVRRVGYDARL